jgi:hypothetical protein
MSGFSCRRLVRTGIFLWGAAVALTGCDLPKTVNESVIGSAGLSIWLEKNEITVLRDPRGREYSADDVSLRILPLLDTQSGKGRGGSQTLVHKPANDVQRKISLRNIFRKLRLKQTLLVLPKWVSAVPLRDEIYPSLLIRKKHPSHLSELLEKLGVGHLKFANLGEKFQTMTLAKIGTKSSTSTKPGITTLYSPQVFEPSSLGPNCVAAVSSDRGTLIAKCMLDEAYSRVVLGETSEAEDVEDTETANLGPYETEFYILADPDLMNNHGLTLAGNAAFAVDTVNELRAGDEKPVFVDTTGIQVLRRSGEPKPDSTLPKRESNLTKFAVYPFSMLWLSGFLVFLVALWRGAVRFGPPVRVYFDKVEASKKASVQAKAHILRLAGQDQAMAAEFANNQMQSLAARFLGETGRIDEKLLGTRLRSLVPELADGLLEAAHHLYSIDTHISAGELARRIDLFDTQYRRVSDAIGHISRRH